MESSNVFAYKSLSQAVSKYDKLDAVKKSNWWCVDSMFGTARKLETRLVDGAIEKNTVDNFVRRNLSKTVELPDKIYDDDRYITVASYYDSKIASVLSMHGGVDLLKNPSYSLFSSSIDPLIHQGMKILGVSLYGLSIDPAMGRQLPGLALFTLRHALWAARHFNYDYIFFVIKKNHSAFYRRVFKATMIGSPRKSPVFSSEISLMGLSAQSFNQLEERFPIFASSEAERTILFGSNDGQKEHQFSLYVQTSAARSNSRSVSKDAKNYYDLAVGIADDFGLSKSRAGILLGLEGELQPSIMEMPDARIRIEYLLKIKILYSLLFEDLTTPELLDKEIKGELSLIDILLKKDIFYLKDHSDYIEGILNGERT